MRARGAGVGLALFALYAATLLTSGGPGPREARVLRAAEGLWAGRPIETDDIGVGLALLAAPLHALGGELLVRLVLAALVALGFVAALAVARRVVPEPYASGAAFCVGASAPAAGWATAVGPDLVGGAALAGATLLALRVRENLRLAEALWAGVLLAALPWLSPKLLAPGAVVVLVLAIWLLRRGRALAAVLATEVVAASLIAYVRVNDTLYERVLPAERPTGAGGVGEHAERVTRLPDLLLVFAVAPVLLLALAGAHALWRSRRDRIARAIPDRREAELAVAVALAAGATVAVTALLLAPSIEAPWFGTRHLAAALPLAAVPVAWGLQRLPQAGTVLGALSVAGGIALAAGA